MSSKRTFQSGGKMLWLWMLISRCWQASRWRFLAVSRKWHCTWQTADLGYRNESSRAFLKSLSCGLTGIILFLKLKTLRSIQLWRTEDREEEREKNTEKEEWHLEYAFLVSWRTGSTSQNFCGQSFTREFLDMCLFSPSPLVEISSLSFLLPPLPCLFQV